MSKDRSNHCILEIHPKECGFIMVIFSESDSTQTTLVTIILAVMGTISLGSIVAAVNSIRKARSEDNRGHRSDALAEWAAINEHSKSVIAQMGSEIHLLRKMAMESQDREQECQLRCSRMEERIGYLEAVLEDNNIRFRKPQVGQDGQRTAMIKPTEKSEGAQL